MTSYDQKPDEAYGVCDECALELPSKEDAREHMNDTMATQPNGGRSSHRIRLKNPTRDERIRSMVGDVVFDAIVEALDRLRSKIARGEVSLDEITGALTYYPDFRDEWDRS